MCGDDGRIERGGQRKVVHNKIKNILESFFCIPLGGKTSIATISKLSTESVSIQREGKSGAYCLMFVLFVCLSDLESKYKIKIIISKKSKLTNISFLLTVVK